MVFHHNLLLAVCLGASLIGIAMAVRLVQAVPPQAAVPEIVQTAYSAPEESFYNPAAAAVTDSISDEEILRSVNNVPQPKVITAQAYLVGDILSGKIYLEKNGSTPMPVASMSKLVTAVVAKDSMPLTEVTGIDESEAAVPPDLSFLKVGENFTVEELLYPLLLSSSNVAAEALASSSNRADFLEMMTGYAWEVGMPTAFFADPSGLSPQNAASARDLFGLARYLYRMRPDILAITRVPMMTIATTSEHFGHVVPNIHPFVTDSRFIGGKTGRTPEAGDTMMTILNINSRATVFVVLGANHGARESDTRMLIEKVESQIQ
jgi:D-alanyl-D-alanine carboxypeptidase (penicillin-binding protein 5/6)